MEGQGEQQQANLSVALGESLGTGFGCLMPLLPSSKTSSLSLKLDPPAARAPLEGNNTGPAA